VYPTIAPVYPSALFRKRAPTIDSAPLPDVMHEQLDYLIDHAAGCTSDCCPICHRYVRVRSIMLEMFTAKTVARVAGCGAG
jgi:hypothetical protein